MCAASFDILKTLTKRKFRALKFTYYFYGIKRPKAVCWEFSVLSNSRSWLIQIAVSVKASKYRIICIDHKYTICQKLYSYSLMRNFEEWSRGKMTEKKILFYQVNTQCTENYENYRKISRAGLSRPCHYQDLLPSNSGLKRMLAEQKFSAKNILLISYIYYFILNLVIFWLL